MASRPPGKQDNIPMRLGFRVCKSCATYLPYLDRECPSFFGVPSHTFVRYRMKRTSRTSSFQVRDEKISGTLGGHLVLAVLSLGSLAKRGPTQRVHNPKGAPILGRILI